jgi:hypothetical protein
MLDQIKTTAKNGGLPQFLPTKLPVPPVFYQSGKGKPYYMKVIRAVREFAFNFKQQEKIV